MGGQTVTGELYVLGADSTVGRTGTAALVTILVVLACLLSGAVTLGVRAVHRRRARTAAVA